MESFWLGKENLDLIKRRERIVLSTTEKIKNQLDTKCSTLYFQISLILTNECKNQKQKMYEIGSHFIQYLEDKKSMTMTIDPNELSTIIVSNLGPYLKKLRSSFKTSEISRFIMFDHSSKFNLAKASFIDVELRKDNNFFKTSKCILGANKNMQLNLSSKQFDSILSYIKIQSKLLAFFYQDYITNTKVKNALNKSFSSINIDFKNLILNDEKLQEEIFETFVTDKTQFNDTIKHYLREKSVKLSTLEVHALLKDKAVSYRISQLINNMLKDKLRNYIRSGTSIWKNDISIKPKKEVELIHNIVKLCCQNSPTSKDSIMLDNKYATLANEVKRSTEAIIPKKNKKVQFKLGMVFKESKAGVEPYHKVHSM